MAHGRIGEGILKSIGSRTPGWVNNIGMSLSGGTFKLVQANGSDFTADDPGWVTLPSTTSGQLVTLKATDANHLFVDDAGTSDIVGEEFGVTTGVAWGQDRPFYLYACNPDNTDANLKFFISPNPALKKSPVTANIGYHDNPMATPSDNGAFFLTATDVTTSHDEVPCVLIGCFRMRMSASDDWTVQTLSSSEGDGIRVDPYVGKRFTLPLGQMGAASGEYLKANGGTPPTWTNKSYQYSVGLDGNVFCWISLDGDGGADGAGAVATQIVLPFKHAIADSLITSPMRFNSSGTGDTVAFVRPTTSDSFFAPQTSGMANINLSQFGNGNRDIEAAFSFKAF